MTTTLRSWSPVGLLVLGGLLLTTVRAQERPELRRPLAAALPGEIQGLPGEDATVTDAEAVVAGFTDYALRVYGTEGDTAYTGPVPWASIYLGFYDQQTQGKTIHSPRNCLPGAGWEAISSEPETLGTGADAFTVNRYVLQNGDVRALVLYWYQGRGRVAHDEYLVKWNLLRDAALRRRTDEALVRIVVPVVDSEEKALAFARSVAIDLKPAVELSLPL